MKKTQSILLVICISFLTLTSFGQSVSLPQASLSVAPMGTVENNGTAIATLFFTEASGADVPATAFDNPNVTISINLQYVALTNGDINLITGALLDYFTPTYDATSNIILLEQNNIIPGDWNGTIDFSIDVIQNSTQAESFNGFNANIAAIDENTNAEGNASIFTYTDETVLNVNNNNLLSFSVFPNPTQGLIDITLENELVTNIELFDLMGKLVLNEAFTGIISTHAIDITHFSSAIYVLKVSTKDAIYTSRIVKE